MAFVDTAESAVADNVSISRLSEFKRVLALVGDVRGFCFESGDLKINVFPASKASSPPGTKGSWRQPVAAAGCCRDEGPEEAPCCEARASQPRVGLLRSLVRRASGAAPARSLTPAS